MEERRNLFMPRGVTAMRMALHNKSENESLDDRMANGDAIGGSESGSHGDKHLLGFELAAMERICAEVTRRDEQGDDEITSEMLATLSLAERRVLREHLVGRLDGGANNNA
ncbi:hypothetical protein BKA66DRAFT_460537 [Pyrenochaeta sp. MPI-SDFR-AT-0127]|nr:hypothetical protein BKA66DRAFT_460537 [Pyrenochaeta sp. MPI-SDFR-AT-0127]